ncbi:MAG: hypothetical protein WB992_12550, partial [Bryobacteraceae bacterium]
MKPRWKSVADPFLLFVLAFAFGTFYLIHPLAHNPRRVLIPAPRLHVPAPVVVDSALPKRPPPPLPDIEKLRANLEAAQAIVRSELADLNVSEAELQEAQRRVDDLRAQLEGLEQKQAALRPVEDSVPNTAEAGRLETVIDQRREKATQLEAALAQERIKPLLAVAITPVNKLPVLVE